MLRIQNAKVTRVARMTARVMRVTRVTRVTARMTGGMRLKIVTGERMNDPMMMARALRNSGRRIDKGDEERDRTKSVWAVHDHNPLWSIEIVRK
jgi:hypothetical protein